MIGHALLMFTPEEEDRLLTGRMTKGIGLDFEMDGAGCVFQVATGLSRPGSRYSLWSSDVAHLIAGEDRMFPRPSTQFAYDCHWRPRMQWGILHGSVAHRYDALTLRFGVERIANAIRSRILTNQLRRQLQAQAVLV